MAAPLKLPQLTDLVFVDRPELEQIAADLRREATTDCLSALCDRLDALGRKSFQITVHGAAGGGSKENP